MKSIVFALLASAALSNAAITISGVAASNLRKADGTTNIPSGTLGLLIVDTDDNGFIGLGAIAGSSNLLSSTLDPDLTPATAGLTVGSTFGGDYVLARLTAPGTGTMSNLYTGNLAVGPGGSINLLNKSFAIVWFDSLLASGSETTAPGGSKYGVLRGLDWAFPSADSGQNFTMSGTDANAGSSYFQVNANTGVSGSTQQANFRTVVGANGGAAFEIIPEPSAALLGALGALGLLRRRRA